MRSRKKLNKRNSLCLFRFDVSVKNTIISVIQYDNQFYIIDGHTRCFIAFQKGIIDIPVEICDIDNTSVEMSKSYGRYSGCS